jgi:xanthine dehydrogenase accessory factor
MELYQAAVDAMGRGEPVALATVVRVEGSTPREVGAKMVVYADGRIAGTVGGGKLEASVIEAATKAIADGTPRMMYFELQDLEAGDPGICGGTAEVFIDVTVPRPTLLLVGAGHVAMPVAEIGHMAGFRVVVLDDRSDMANAERFPHTAERIVADIVETLHDYAFAPDTYIVIVTRGHALDEKALREVIDVPVAYVGMIGSRRKVRVIFDHLRADGIDEALIERVRAPIGLDIGSETPAEIAVSIVAQLIAERRLATQPSGR